MTILKNTLFLVFLLNTLAHSRGCNAPYRVCHIHKGHHVCTWYDRNACEHCSEQECTKAKGCHMVGFLGPKQCAADYDLGHDHHEPPKH